MPILSIILWGHKMLTVIGVASVSVLLEVIIAFRGDLSPFVDSVVPPVWAKDLFVVVLAFRVGFGVANLLLRLGKSE